MPVDISWEMPSLQARGKPKEYETKRMNNTQPGVKKEEDMAGRSLGKGGKHLSFTAQQKYQQERAEIDALKRFVGFMKSKDCLYGKILKTDLFCQFALWPNQVRCNADLDRFHKRGWIRVVGDQVELTDVGKTKSGLMCSIDWPPQLVTMLQYLGCTKYGVVVEINTLEGLIGATHPSIADFPFMELAHAVSFLNGMSGKDDQTQPLDGGDEMWCIKEHHIIPRDLRNSAHNLSLIVRQQQLTSGVEGTPEAAAVEEEVVMAQQTVQEVSASQETSEVEDPILGFEVGLNLHHTVVLAIENIKNAVRLGLTSRVPFTSDEFDRVYLTFRITGGPSLRSRYVHQLGLLVYYQYNIGQYMWNTEALRGYFLYGPKYRDMIKKEPLPPLPLVQAPETPVAPEPVAVEESSVPEEESIAAGECTPLAQVEQQVVEPDPIPDSAPVDSSEFDLPSWMDGVGGRVGAAQQAQLPLNPREIVQRVRELHVKNMQGAEESASLRAQVASLTAQLEEMARVRDRLAAENAELRGAFSELTTIL